MSCLSKAMADRILMLVAGMILSFQFCGCQNTPKSDFDPRMDGAKIGLDAHAFESIEGRVIESEWLEPSTEPYRLGVGDWVEVEITGIAGSRSETFVMPDGKVYYDLAGGVEADGLTIADLGQRLTEALKRDYANPSVNVTLREVKSQRAWLLGRLNKPGLYPLSQPTTLLEGLSLAGGLFTSRFSGSTEELADLGSSFVLRDGQVLPVDFLALVKQGDMSQNIYLKNGDYVYLPSSLSQNIHVLGEVMQPQAIGFKDKINLISAIANAKGPTPSARLDQILIIRGSLTSPKVAVVNFEEILSGEASNVELQPFDIIWVPDRPFEFLERYFWVIFDAAATTIAVREGGNAVERVNTDAPNVSIPLGE